MKRIRLFTIVSTLTLLAALLAACGLIGTNTGGQPNVNDLATMSAATVSARLTQISFSTLVAQVTPQVNQSSTPNVIIITATSQPAATVTPKPPAPTPTEIPCNAASLIKDVTVKDGTIFTAGDSFTKTWQIKNVGSCTWTKDFVIYFYSGNAMGAAAAVNFPGSVKPGETVDLSVSMAAPGTTGEFTGKWMFKSGSGKVFGVGAEGGGPVTVVIKVAAIPTPKDTAIVYDFVGNMCKAEWRTNGGFITCPSGGVDTNLGSITRTYTPILPGGSKDDEGALITVPAKGGDGMIQGQFPKMTLHAGDHFKAVLFCQGGASACNVTYKLIYKDANSSTTGELGSWTRTLADGIQSVDVDLSALDGKDVIFFLKVISGGDSNGDIANWLAARISHP